MNIILKLFFIVIWTIPSYFMYRGIGQVFQYIKDQSWTEHYSMKMSNIVITDRFRFIDLAVDLVIGFILYGEIFLRSKNGYPFTSDLVFYISAVVFTLEKILRYKLRGQLL